MASIIAAVGYSNIGSITQAVVGSAVVGGVLAYELPHKVAGMDAGQVTMRAYVKGGVNVVCRCLPEVLGVVTILTMSVLLRVRGDSGLALVDPVEIQSWNKILQEWPILMGADTLLNLQCMLRLLLLMFLGIRADQKGRSPLSGVASVFLLGSMLARSTLSTRSLGYRLEGPLSLGGDLGVACEAAMIPFLAAVSMKALKRLPVVAGAIGLAVAYSRVHYFRLAENTADDTLFTLAHILELFAALAYLLRTISIYCTSTKENRSSAFVGFMHFLMPAQQALAAYYWLTAFTPDSQLPIGNGKPWCLLIWTNLLALGALLCSLALYVGECFGSTSTHQDEAVAIVESVPGETEMDQLDHYERAAFAPLAAGASDTSVAGLSDVILAAP